jgi:hypothetical protein
MMPRYASTCKLNLLACLCSAMVSVGCCRFALADENATAGRPFLRLPFAPLEAHISNDGKLLLLLRHTHSRPQRGGDDIEPGTYCRVALVNLKPDPAGAVDSLPHLAASREMATPIMPWGAAIDEHYAYLPSNHADVRFALSPKDLSDAKRITRKGLIAFLPIGQTLYAAAETRPIIPAGADLSTVAFAIPTFESIDVPSPPAGYRAKEVLPKSIAGGWLFNNVFYDGTMSRPRMLIGSIVYSVNDVFRNPGPPLADWGVSIDDGDLRRVGGQLVGVMSPRAGFRPGAIEPVILPDVPATAMLEVADKTAATDTRFQAAVTLRDLQSSALINTVSLMDESVLPAQAPDPAGEPSFNPRADGLLIPAPGSLIAIVRDRLFVLPTRGPGAVMDSAKLPNPLHFDLPQNVMAIGADMPAAFAHTAVGGMKPFEFSLLFQVPGVELDKTTGTIMLDGKRLAADAVDRLMRKIQFGFRRNITKSSATSWPTIVRRMTIEESVEAYRSFFAPRYRAVTGRNPAGIPAGVVIYLTVTDKNQQKCVLYEAALLDMPSQSLIDRARALDAAEKTKK